MSLVKRTGRSRYSNKTGSGIVNSLINKLPFELHLPGYQYCGPGTKLKKRLARGDLGINPLDAACKKHDIVYSQNLNNLGERHKADSELEQRAWERVKSKDSTASEKASAWLVTNIMKAKQRFGMGYRARSNKGKSIKKGKRLPAKSLKGVRKRKRLPKLAFGKALRRPIQAELRKAGGKKIAEKDILNASRIALAAARKFLRKSGGKRRICTPRIIPIPKVGGLLPLIPIFAGLSALGSLAGGVGGIVRAIKTAKNENSQKTGGRLTLNSKGNGIYLKPYRSGLGLFMNKSKNS